VFAVTMSLVLYFAVVHRHRAHPVLIARMAGAINGHSEPRAENLGSAHCGQGVMTCGPC